MESSDNSNSIEANVDAIQLKEGASAASLDPSLIPKSQFSPARHQNRDRDAVALTLPTTSLVPAPEMRMVSEEASDSKTINASAMIPT